MILINLLPRKPKPLVTLWKDGAILAGVILVVLIAWTIVMIRMNGRINEIKRDMVETRKKIESSKMDLQKIEQLKKDKSILENKIDIIHSLREKQSGPVHMLEHIGLAIPEQIWLDNILNRDSSLRLEGVAPSYNAVSEFMRKLNESPYLSNIDLENIQQSMVRDKKFHRFRITCNVEFIVKTSAKE